MQPNPLVKPEEAAEVFGVARKTVLRWCKEGKLEHVRLNGQQVRITRAAFERAVREGIK